MEDCGDLPATSSVTDNQSTEVTSGKGSLGKQMNQKSLCGELCIFFCKAGSRKYIIIFYAMVGTPTGDSFWKRSSYQDVGRS